MIMSKSKDPLSDTFTLVLLGANLRTQNATGDTRDDFLYDQAESVRDPSKIASYVHVTYEGVEYGPVRVTWGPLDGDKEKSTVLIQTNEGKWYKLWFYDRDRS